MADLAKYVRIYDPSPLDDTVTKRQLAIKDVVGQLNKTRNVSELVNLGASMAAAFSTGSAPDPLGEIVGSAIKKHASAFVPEERELEVTVIAAVAMITVLAGPETANNVVAKDIIAASLWSALSYQVPVEDPKLEQLRDDLLNGARERCLQRAEASRKRSIPPKEIPSAPDGDITQIGKSLAVATTVVEALQVNAALDREELDVLWWALGGRSPILNRSYDSLTPSSRGVVRGVELGILLRRVPSQSHRNLALSGVPPVDAKTAAALLAELADVRQTLLSKIPARSTIEANPSAFPLLTAVIGGNIAEGIAHSGDEWSARAVLEAGLASVCETPSPRI